MVPDEDELDYDWDRNVTEFATIGYVALSFRHAAAVRAWQIDAVAK
jgi:hypothetical protein